MDELYDCFHSASSDFIFTISNSPYYHHRPLILSHLPPPPVSSLISSSDDFTSFHHDHHPMFGSEPSSTFFYNAASPNADYSSTLGARIAAHPLYYTLLQAYIDCQKVGSPPEIFNLLDEIQRDHVLSRSTASTSCFGADPELDEFMESYCDILSKYRSGMTKSFNEATSYLKSMEAQLSSLCKYNTSVSLVSADEAAGSSEEDVSGSESAEMMGCLPYGEGQELKDKLLLKYSGYISSLKHDLSKRKKKGKLPKVAKQQLLDWWSDHDKWPYPTEVDKISLAESTGLDQKQINNWFINQRKRHWKPSENMQFMKMDEFCGPFYTND